MEFGLNTARKKPIITYSKKSRTYANDGNPPTKRVRLSIKDGVKLETENPQSDSSVSTIDTALSDSKHDDNNAAQNDASSPPSSPTAAENADKPANTSTTVKSASFTLTTRRKPLFKR